MHTSKLKATKNCMSKRIQEGEKINSSTFLSLATKNCIWANLRLRPGNTLKLTWSFNFFFIVKIAASSLKNCLFFQNFYFQNCRIYAEMFNISFKTRLFLKRRNFSKRFIYAQNKKRKNLTNLKWRNFFPRWRDFLDIAPERGNTRKDGIWGFQCQSYMKHN